MDLTDELWDVLFTARFKADLAQPGLRVLLTADSDILASAAELGRTVVWLHTFG